MEKRTKNWQAMKEKEEKKNMMYTVKKIEEDVDFGCEECTDAASVQAVVTLEDEQGALLVRKFSDAYLYEQDINEGTKVLFHEDTRLLEKVTEGGHL